MIRPDVRNILSFQNYSPDSLHYRTPRAVVEDQYSRHKQVRTSNESKPSDGLVSWPRKLYNKIKADKLILIRFFIKGVFFVVFVGYAFYQAIVLLISFAQNPYEISLEIQTPTNLTLPAVSVCFEYNLNYEKLAETIETRKKMSASKRLDPTVEVVINTTPNVDDLVESCTVLDGNAKPVKCTELTTVRQSINKKNKCFTWFSHGAWKPPENETKATYRIRAIKNREWLLIKLKNLTTIKGDTVGIGIHENHVPIVPDLADPQFTEVIRTWYPDALVSRVTLTYEASSMTRLKDPYPDKCIDYKKSQAPVSEILDKLSVSGDKKYFDKSGHLISNWLSDVYASHRELVDSCIGYLYADRSENHWPPMLLASKGQQKDFYVSYANNIELPASNQSENIIQAAHERRLCNRLFPFPECKEITYTIQIKTTHYDNTPNNMEIALFAPTGTQMHMKQVPKYESREIIAVISGIFSFWVGISAVSLLTPIAPFLAKILTKITSTSQTPASRIVSSAYQQRLPFYVDWSTGENRHGYGQVSSKSHGLNKKVHTPPSLHTYSINWG